VWRTYLAGAAPGHGGTNPEAVLAEVLNSQEPIGADLQQLLYVVAERLADTGALALAVACHGLAFLASERSGDLHSACDVAMRRGRCHKLAAEWADAGHWYDRSMQWAENLDDWPRYGEALSGLTGLRFEQGATADARQMAERLLELSEERDIPVCVALAHHHLALVAHNSGSLEDSIWHGWQAAVSHPRKEGRLRAIFMTGVSLVQAGHLDAAEDALRLAAAGIKEISHRVLAMSELAFVAALRGDGEEYDRRLERLEAIGWEQVSRHDRVKIVLDQAKAHATLNRLDEARRRFQETILLAEQDGFNREVIQADEALTLLQSSTDPWSSHGPIATQGRSSEVEVGLRKLVEGASLSGTLPVTDWQAPVRASTDSSAAGTESSPARDGVP
jgi:tetratricopeptide (TPR) repeat protein